jgi:hypothetical protein
MPVFKRQLKARWPLLSSVGFGRGDSNTPVKPPPPPSDTTAPGTVADLGISSGKDSSATLTWTAPGDNAASGTAKEYDLRYSTASWNLFSPVQQKETQ